MASIEKILSISSQGFIKSGIAYTPYCSASEKLYLTYFSQVALGQEELNLGRTIVTAGDVPIVRGVAESIRLPGGYFKGYFKYGAFNALAIRSTLPELEGMILGYNIAGVRHAGRHLIGDIHPLRKYDFPGGPDEMLSKNLKELGLEFPEKDGDAIVTMMALLALCDTVVGKHFEENIDTFTKWYKATHPRSATYYW